jgi:hypothetical protein
VGSTAEANRSQWNLVARRKLGQCGRTSKAKIHARRVTEFCKSSHVPSIGACGCGGLSECSSPLIVFWEHHDRYDLLVSLLEIRSSLIVWSSNA